MRNINMRQKSIINITIYYLLNNNTKLKIFKKNVVKMECYLVSSSFKLLKKLLITIFKLRVFK